MRKEFPILVAIALIALSFGTVYFLELNFYEGFLLILFVALVLTSFFLSVGFTGGWIRIANRMGLTGKDMNKYEKKDVAESGGISPVLAIIFGILLYIFLKTFFLGSESHLIEILTMSITLLLSGILGFVDDIVGWKVGLKQWQKPLLTLAIAIPLVVINAGNSSINLPFFGTVDLGLLYPLLIVPIGIVGASNAFNMLAGMNGLEAGLGAIIVGSLGFVAITTGQLWLATLCGISVAALLGFLVFNKYPSRIFPGDSLTYSIGALIAAVAIVGSMERLALAMFLLYFIEFGMKARYKFKSESFAKPNEDETISVEKIRSLTHVGVKAMEKIKKNVYEKDVVYFLYVLQALISVLAIVIF